MRFLGEWMREIGSVLAASGPWLLTGLLVAGLVRVDRKSVV